MAFWYKADLRLPAIMYKLFRLWPTDLGQDSWVTQDMLPASLQFDFDTLWNLHPACKGIVKMYDRIYPM